MSELLDLGQVRIVDLSMTIEPHWRFQPSFSAKELPKPRFTFHSTLLSMGAHGFSHADAPRHVSPTMATIDQMPLADFIGPSALVDVADLGDNAELTAEVLAARTGHVRAGDIVVLRSDHETRHPTTGPEYWTESPWVSASGAKHLLGLGVKGVAFDFPQDRAIREDYDSGFVRAEDPDEDWACHTFLLPVGVVQFEYLANMRALSASRGVFLAAPLKIKDSDGGPARAFVLENNEEDAA